MQRVHFILFVIGILSFFSVLFTRYYLLGNWSTVLFLLLIDSLLLTVVSFLKINGKK